MRQVTMKKKDAVSGDPTRRTNKAPNRLTKWTLVSAGTIFVGLGVVGIFLPLLPTTPFLLLAAACYARSSERFHNWLLGNRWVGKYIKDYREGNGISPSAKFLIISLLWVVILFSAVFVVPILFVQVILILVAVGVTVHVLSIRALKERRTK